jgi:hypothetical protein
MALMQRRILVPQVPNSQMRWLCLATGMEV